MQTNREFDDRRQPTKSTDKDKETETEKEKKRKKTTNETKDVKEAAGSGEEEDPE